MKRIFNAFVRISGRNRHTISLGWTMFFSMCAAFSIAERRWVWLAVDVVFGILWTCICVMEYRRVSLLSERLGDVNDRLLDTLHDIYVIAKTEIDSRGSSAADGETEVVADDERRR